MHPSLFYIKYMIAASRSGTAELALERVNKVLAQFKCPALATERYTDILAGFDVPEDLVVSNKKHEGTKKFMAKHGLLPMWHPGEDERRLLEELGLRPMILQNLQLLIIGDLPFDGIADKISVKFHVEPAITAKMVELYHHFFWNYTLVGYDDWDSILFDNRLKDHYLAALRGSKEQAMWRAGFNPKIDGKRALRDAYRSIHFRIEATRSMPDTRDSTSILTTLVKELATVHHVLYSQGAMLEDVIREFKNINVETAPSGVKSLINIASGGSYSDSGDSKKNVEGQTS